MSDEFIRIMIRLENAVLKVDFVNDVEAHFGLLTALEDLFPRIDSWRNLLSNKVSALSRLESKDFVAIFFIALKYPFDWEQIISEAREKDLWVEPITVSRLIREFPARNMQAIKWIKPVNETKLLKLLETVSDDILKGLKNSAFELEKRPKIPKLNHITT